MTRNYNGQLTIQLEPDEACVVLEKKFWDHMIQWYTIMANDCEDPDEKGNWASIIHAVEHWVKSTYVDPKSLMKVVIEDDDDGWN